MLLPEASENIRGKEIPRGSRKMKVVDCSVRHASLSVDSGTDEERREKGRIAKESFRIPHGILLLRFSSFFHLIEGNTFVTARRMCRQLFNFNIPLFYFLFSYIYLYKLHSCIINFEKNEHFFFFPFFKHTP